MNVDRVSKRNNSTVKININAKQDLSGGKVQILSWNNGKLNEIAEEIVSFDDKISRGIKVIVTADDFHKFQQTNIQKQIELVGNYTDKIDEKIPDNKTHVKMITTKNMITQNSVSTTTETITNASENKKVFVIKNLSGKTVKFVPKSICKIDIDNVNLSPQKELTPMTKITSPISEIKAVTQNNCGFLINKNNASKIKISVLKSVDTKVLDNSKIIQLSQSVSNIKILPNTFKPVQVQTTKPAQDLPENSVQLNMTTFQKILPKEPITPAVSPVKRLIRIVDEKVERNVPPKVVKKKENVKSHAEISTQTEKKMFTDTSMQTEPNILDLDDSCPDIEQLVEYLLETPKYSTGIEEEKKSNLIDMSKNITMKGKVLPPTATKSPIPRQESLKIQMFMDLNNCVNFDSKGNMPIHNAVLEHNLKGLQKQCFILKLRGRSVNIESNHGLTPLQLALMHNCNTEIVVQILKCGAFCDVIDQEGNTGLHLAVLNSNAAVLSIIVKMCHPTTKNLKNDEGMTALMLACLNDKVEMVEILLKNGADPNITDDKSGRTAFFHAVENEANEITQLLLRNNANPKIRNFLGLTALEAVKDAELITMTLVEDYRGSVTYKTSSSSSTSENVEKRTKCKSPPPRVGKKSKLSFVTSYQKVELETVNKISKRRRKNDE